MELKSFWHRRLFGTSRVRRLISLRKPVPDILLDLMGCKIKMNQGLIISSLIVAVVFGMAVETRGRAIAPQELTVNPDYEKQARRHYESGRYREAIAILQRAIATYANQDDIRGEVTAWRNLALVYHELGEWQQGRQAIVESFNGIQDLPETPETQKLIAQSLDVKGQLKLSAGRPEDALETWKVASDIYQEIGDSLGLTRSQINQAQALQALGLYAQAIKTLTSVKNYLEQQPDTLLKAQALRSLGDVLRGVGQLDESQAVLQQSLKIAETHEDGKAIATTLLSLGNTARLQQQPEAALNWYQKAVGESPSLEITIQAKLNQLNLSLDEQQWSEALRLERQIKQELDRLPTSQVAIYARINLARNQMKLVKASTGIKPRIFPPQIARQLVLAARDASTLEDKRAESYALGNLGTLYEQNQRWEDAEKSTQKALLLAQAINAPDIAYQWQWQLGRILGERGETEGAIASYSKAVNHLQSLRSDIVAISSDVQFSFRETVEPVYRELVTLLLSSAQKGITPSQENLKQAREAIEALQLAELDNFFRDACLDTRSVNIDEIDSNSAIFYTIILGDRLEIILALPGQPLRHHSPSLEGENIETTLKKMVEALTLARERVLIETFLEPSQNVYNWIVRPFESELQNSGITNLVFVSDGALRNIPMASLYDGKQYLAENYSVATAPSLQLIDPKALAREEVQVLSAGLSEARQGFSALPGVEYELERIKARVPVEILLNRSFTEQNFEVRVRELPVQIVHLATHGEFSSQLENTFLLTWDEKIDIDELNSLLRTDKRQRQPIELLVLSACKTAAGDNRATLGLAGVAVRAGARSTLASLWYVSDEATALLMTGFYRELAKPDVTKAEALRRAQQEVLQNPRFSHPYFWSAFVLVGNWL